MYQKDYILRMLEMLATLIAGILGLVVIFVPSFVVSPGLIQKTFGARSARAASGEGWDGSDAARASAARQGFELLVCGPCGVHAPRHRSCRLPPRRTGRHPRYRVARGIDALRE